MADDTDKKAFITQDERERLRHLIAPYWGSMRAIAKGVEPPVAPSTMTLWFKGRVQSIRLDIQVPGVVKRYLADQEEQLRIARERRGLMKRYKL